MSGVEDGAAIPFESRKACCSSSAAVRSVFANLEAVMPLEPACAGSPAPSCDRGCRRGTGTAWPNRVGTRNARSSPVSTRPSVVSAWLSRRWPPQWPAVGKWPAHSRLLAVAAAGHLPTAATPPLEPRPMPIRSQHRQTGWLGYASVLTQTHDAGSLSSLARIEAADAVQTNGFGSLLCSAR